MNFQVETSSVKDILGQVLLKNSIMILDSSRGELFSATYEIDTTIVSCYVIAQSDHPRNFLILSSLYLYFRTLINKKEEGEKKYFFLLCFR